MRDRKPGVLERPLAPGEAERERRARRGGLSRPVLTEIGKQLRAYYGFLIEPVPDRFAELMRRIDKPDEPEA
jgi:Anti-sigma factor NepR